MGLFDFLRHSPLSAPVTDPQAVASLVRIAPKGQRKAQDVLVAAKKYVKSGGREGMDRARIQALQATVYALNHALQEDAYMPQETDKTRTLTFLDEFARAYPNWPDEYAALKRFVPQCF